ncbi:MAG: MFS transporter [Pseudomonadota bacterium]
MLWKKRPAGVLASLLAIHLLAHIDRNMLLAFAPQMIKDLALSNVQYGFLVGAVWVLSFGFMAIFMGTLADRFSRTRVIAGGLMIWSVCTVASGYAQSFEQMVAARFFVASGEAALVPAAVALLSELFSERRRGTAIGLFFMGIPLGIGCSFLLAGSYGATHGWRFTFNVLGMIGVVVAVPLCFLKEGRGTTVAQARGEPFRQQVAAMWQLLRHSPALRHTITGFMLAHLVFAGLAFTQLWLVNERGMDAGGIATRIGLLQLLFGTVGSVVGGAGGDRIAAKFAGGHASFMLLLVALCAPFMLAYRFVPAGSVLFYIGMCASFFLPLALYGPANTSIQGMTPSHMRSTVAGFTMMVINVFAIAAGNLVVGFAGDYLGTHGAGAPLTMVLFGADLLAILSALFFALAARSTARTAPANAPAQTVPATP